MNQVFSPMIVSRSPHALWMLGALLMVLSSVVSAQQPSLNTVQVPVADRSAEARNQALREAMNVVLVRITGQTSPQNLPGAERLLAQPANWVAQYGYSGEGSNLSLDARFDLRIISEQLVQAGAPVWGRSRPTVLVWAAPDRGEIASEGSGDGFVRGLRERAAYRGLPIMLPAMDAEDRERISAADVRGRFDRQIQNASQRYEAPLSVSVVYYTRGTPSARWRLMQEGNSLSDGEVRGASEAEVGQALADAVSDYLAGVYAVQGGDASALTLRVEGIERLQSWADIQQFVSQQAGVRSVTLARLAGDAAELQVDFAGDPAQLERLLRLHRQLGACSAAARGSSGEAVSGTLRLCWQPAG